MFASENDTIIQYVITFFCLAKHTSLVKDMTFCMIFHCGAGTHIKSLLINDRTMRISSNVHLENLVLVILYFSVFLLQFPSSSRSILHF